MTFVKLVQEDEFTEKDEIIHSNVDCVSYLNNLSVVDFIRSSKTRINVNDKEESFLSSGVKDRDVWKKIGVCCLNYFVASNFFGVDHNLVNDDLNQLILSLFTDPNCSNGHQESVSVDKIDGVNGVNEEEDENQKINMKTLNSYLSIADETFKDMKCLPMLAMARYIYCKSDAASIWRLRYLIVHQHVLETPNSDIYLELKRTLKSFEEFIKDEVQTMKGHKLKLQVAIELASAFIWYSDIASASPIMDAMSTFVGVDVSFDGVLGKRTKFQVENKSQLIVKIGRRKECFLFPDFEQTLKDDLNTDKKNLASAEDEDYNPDKLKNVNMADETILDAIKFETPTGANHVDARLLQVEEAYLLLLITKLKRMASTDDELANEELITFINYVINKTNIFPIKFKALYIRSLIERHSSRRIERSMMQLEHLVQAVQSAVRNNSKNYEKSVKNVVINEEKIGKNPQNSEKIGKNPQNSEKCAKIGFENFYMSMFEPFWIVEKQLADTLRALGCVKASLDIYERLHCWEDIIFCYHKLDRKDKAEMVIRDKLASDPLSPYLWCLLGDATDDLDCYEKSWKLSESKYYKSKRAIGNYHFKRKDYAASINPYQASLKINSLQIDVWQKLAFAALTVEDYDLSARAYRRFLEFEPDTFEAWNNLSKALIKMDKKMTAFSTLQEAIKCNFDEWRLWDNLMIVSIDVGAFDEVIRCYHRLMDIKKVHEDDQIIELITDAVLNNVKDMNGNSASKLAPKLIQLLVRISATFSSFTLQASLFKLHLMASGDKKMAFTDNNLLDKLIECIKKANRAMIRDADWNRTPTSVIHVADQSIQTLKLISDLISRIDGDADKKKVVNTFKLSYLSVIKTIELASLKWDVEKDGVRNVDEKRNELQTCLDEIVKITDG